jgi:uncharacterized membrane protein YkgB
MMKLSSLLGIVEIILGLLSIAVFFFFGGGKLFLLMIMCLLIIVVIFLVYIPLDFFYRWAKVTVKCWLALRAMKGKKTID